jgi:competence protein CoiA
MEVKMQYALVNGQRRNPESGLRGECQFDGHPMVGRCGPIRAKHWAHLGAYSCDPWWKNKTEWHLTWQEHFPENWREISAFDENGVKHIADVKTDQGWVIEFQNSPIKLEERQSREVFYRKMVWVVNGNRRKNDTKHFIDAVNDGVRETAKIIRLRWYKGTLLREWTRKTVPVFFDFGEQSRVWWLHHSDGPMYVVAFSRTEFIQLHGGGPTQASKTFEKVLEDLRFVFARWNPQPSDPLAGFQRYADRQKWARSRRRF